jgi:hypothetical protein
LPEEHLSLSIAVRVSITPEKAEARLLTVERSILYVEITQQSRFLVAVFDLQRVVMRSGGNAGKKHNYQY